MANTDFGQRLTEVGEEFELSTVTGQPALPKKTKNKTLNYLQQVFAVQVPLLDAIVAGATKEHVALDDQ